ncbi:MAG: 2-oxoacid:acceptor oxidoreductase family protein [Acholeplasmataceae bacterium]|nr:2-oxoacid:acceptor oxidoreductase family protein [Acholeplasmataceae bacterium]
MRKTTQITIAGFGGQGVMVLGQTLAYAGNEMGLNTLWYPSYGPETRGGTANCAVTISKDPINSPIFSKATTLIALNTPSLKKFENKVIDGGNIIYNSNMILEEVRKENTHIYPIPANDIAMKLGNQRVSNMVILGAYLEVSKEFSVSIINEVLKNILTENKQAFIPINLLAIEAGINYIKGIKA